MDIFHFLIILGINYNFSIYKNPLFGFTAKSLKLYWKTRSGGKIVIFVAQEPWHRFLWFPEAFKKGGSNLVELRQKMGQRVRGAEAGEDQPVPTAIPHFSTKSRYSTNEPSSLISSTITQAQSTWRCPATILPGNVCDSPITFTLPYRPDGAMWEVQLTFYIVHCVSLEDACERRRKGSW